jgi:uncharacterized NAD(P)/FAD-binding protein YdhS
MQAVSATIAIIGGGFSGTVLAANLLRRPPATPTRILLFERAGRIGCGVAYAPACYPFQLNVPAGRMSALSYEPMHLLDYARRRLPQVDADTYLTREFYGQYLGDFLQAAELAAPLHVKLERIHGEVNALRPQRAHGPIQVQLADQAWLAHQVVLACGDPSPVTRPYALEVAHLPGYVRDPYAADAVAAIGSDERSLLLVGTGLTMIDLAVAAAAANPGLRITALSRHGRLPQTQSPHSHAPVLEVQSDLHGLPASRSVAAAAKALRRLVDEALQAGGDWREAITRARDCVPTIWQNFNETERRRFLRHARVYWDTSRHRMPPDLAARIAELRRSGRLQVYAGRILRLQAEGRRILAHWRPRGARGLETQRADRVIDCSGPDRRLERTADPLWRQLLDAGLVHADSTGLGLRTGPLGAVIDASGRLSHQIFYLGPMLRATYWEATAVGELRARAETLAAALTSREPKLSAETDAA